MSIPKTLLTLVGILSCALLAEAAEPRGMVYKFGATWCSPCQRVAPIVDRLQREGLPIRSVDIDQQQEVASRFRVDRVPTFVLVVDGKEMDRVVGMMTEGELRTMLARIPAATQPLPSNPGVTDPPAAAPPQALPNAVPNSDPFRATLGTAAPFPRPTEQPVHQEPVVPAASENGGLAGLWPFGRREQEPPVFRGTDATLNNAPALGTAAPVVGDPMAASVRIRVKQGDGINLGSGTIVLSREGHTLIITCGHIFRNFTDAGTIEVDVFENGQSKLYLAKLEKFDDQADVGLISIPTDHPLPVISIGRKPATPQDGDQVACIGCSAGDQPTREQLRVTAIDRYEGPHNVECTGIPVRGRSGGGLFNQQGELIGVCIAADTKGQRGLYAGLLAVHALLDECSLTALYEPPQAPVTPTTPVAAPNLLATTPGAIPPAFLTSTTSPPQTAAPAATAATQTAVDVEAGTAEVVVIIRDKQQPGAPQRVVIIHEASPSFLRYLNGELQPAPGAVGTELGNTTQPRQPLTPTSQPDSATTSTPANQQPAAALPQTMRTLRTASAPLSRTAGLQPTSLHPQRFVRTAQ